MDVLKHKNDTTHTIVAEYNTRIKTYANKEKKVIFHSYSNLKGYGQEKKKNSLIEITEEERERQRKKNLYRTKMNIVDLIYHNGLKEPWQYFVTLTFNPGEVDSLDYDVVVKAMRKWIDNMQHQNPGMSYVMTPELHKSGRVHWHGVFKNVPNWNLVQARTPSGRLIKKNGLQIYNLTNYKYGYTTVSEIQNQEAVSVYVSKYITKDLIDKAYKKRYWCSRDLEKPPIEYAQLDEESLTIFIDKYNIKDLVEKKTENSKSLYLSLNTDFTSNLNEDLV